jgi:predicted ferric reductase
MCPVVEPNEPRGIDGPYTSSKGGGPRHAPRQTLDSTSIVQIGRNPVDYIDQRRQTAPDGRPGWDAPSRSGAPGWDAPSPPGTPTWQGPTPAAVPAARHERARQDQDAGDYSWFEEGAGRPAPIQTVDPEAYFDDDRTWQTRPEVDPGWDIAPPDDPRWDDPRWDEPDPVQRHPGEAYRDDPYQDDPYQGDPRRDHDRRDHDRRDHDGRDHDGRDRDGRTEHRQPTGGDWDGPADAEPIEPRHAAVDTNLEAAWQNYLAEQEVPDAPEEGGRRLIWMLFGATLMTSVALWWFTTPGGSVHGTGDMLTAGGRITGMVAGYLLLAQVLLMTRLTLLERWIGAHHLMSWHRDLGGALLVLVLAHVALTIVGYAAQDRSGIGHEAWTVISTYPDMIKATIATAILVLTGLLAIRMIRRLLPYETWYYLHLGTYLILILGYGHQFTNGEQLRTGIGFARWYWIGLYLFVIACLVWGRVITPVRLNTRHKLRFAEAVDEGAGMVSLYIAGKRLTELPVQAGQYFRWRFLARGQWWQAHPFSLSEAPNGKWLRLTIKMVGDHTRALPHLRPGVRVIAEGPSGVFTANHRVAPRALLIAAGSGIAPIRALLEDLPHGTTVLYRATSEEDIVFREELDDLAARGGDRVLYVLGRRGDRWPAYVFSPKGMREIVPDVRRRDVYLCGPPGMVKAAVHTLRRLRVPRNQIHLDPFEF